jgi:CSLREA domain-containing protein
VPKRVSFVLCAAVVLATFVGIPPAASAVTIRVTTTADAMTDDGECSLREAVLAANTNTRTNECRAGSNVGKDVIQLPGGTYQVGMAPAGDDAAENGDLDLLEGAVISGAKSGKTTIKVDSTLVDRIFHVLDANVDFRRLTLQDGNGDVGGAISIEQDSDVRIFDSILKNNAAGATFVDDPASLVAKRSVFRGNYSGSGGGAIKAEGDVSLMDSTLRGNVSGYFGGAIHMPFGNASLIKIQRSLLYDNQGSSGGGIFMEGGSGSELIVENSTISGNTALRSGPCCEPYAGAIYHNDKTTIVGSVITGNTAENIAGLQVDSYESSDADIKDSILANNFESDGENPPATNCSGNIESLGGVIEYPDHVWCLETPHDTDQVADPLLDDLADNGGPTLTHALGAESPALGKAMDCLPTDQRGAPRAGDCDIGPYELVRCEGIVVDRVGTDLRDSLVGDADINGILALAGNDTLEGAEADDALCGGGGNDALGGEAGGDELLGQAGADALKGRGGNDTLLGGAGPDFLHGGPGADTCKGGPGKDVLRKC